MSSYQIIRTHTSTYQGVNFASIEKMLLESLPGIKYCDLNNWDPQGDVVLITNTHTQLAQLPSTLLKQTKLIIHPNSGYDHFANEQIIWEKIPLVVGHQIRAQAVAEYTLGCLFEATELPQHISWDKGRLWPRKLLNERKILLFGLGHIGKKVWNTLKALGANITAIDPYVEGASREWKHVNLSEIDTILVCCSLNTQTREMFNQDFFKHAHPELLFINGARGKIVSEKALKEFLLAHPKAFAFLDVFEKEPFENEWINFPQVWKTSHIAGVSANLDQNILDFEKKVLRDFLELKSEEFSIKYQNELLQNKIKNGVLI